MLTGLELRDWNSVDKMQMNLFWLGGKELGNVRCDSECSIDRIQNGVDMNEITLEWYQKNRVYCDSLRGYEDEELALTGMLKAS